MNANMHQTIEEAEAATENFDVICCRKPQTKDVDLECAEGAREKKPKEEYDTRM